WEPSSAAAGARPSRVVIVGLGGATWDDVAQGHMPNFRRMSEEGALGAVTVRTLSRRPRPAEAWATLGAGTRVKATSASMSATRRLERGRHLSSLPGALGEALHGHGKHTAVVGTPDATLAAADVHGRVDDVVTDPGQAVGPGGELLARTDLAVVDTGGAESGDLVLGEVLRAAPPGTLVIAMAPVPPTADRWQLAPIAVAGPGVPHGYVVSPSTK